MKHIRHGKYRLTNYDYSKEGAYFITVRVSDKENVLSTIEDNLVFLTQMGQEADRIINLTENQYKNVFIDKYVIMPDHFHLIVVIGKNTIDEDGIYEIAFEDNFAQPTIKKSGIPNNPMEINVVTLGKVLKWLKGRITYEIRAKKANIEFGWQGRFNDRIIRNQSELEHYRTYIEQNPQRWDNRGY